METFSYVHNPGCMPLVYRTIPDVFNGVTFKQTGEAFVHHKMDGTREAISFEELKIKADRFASFLNSKGKKKGERVAICGQNSINWIIGEMGIILAGAVSLHVTIGQKDATDVMDILNLAECKLILFDTGTNGEHRNAVPNLLDACKMSVSSETKICDVILLRTDATFDTLPDIERIVNANYQTTKSSEIYPEEPVVIFTTSGSSGKPKMVEHTHFNISNIHMESFFKQKENGVTISYNDLPFGWSLGSILNDINLGQKRVFSEKSKYSNASVTEQIWNIIRSEKCDTAFLVPHFLDDLLSVRHDGDSYRLKYIITGGQVISKKYLKVIGVYADRLLIPYGSTEVKGIAVKVFKHMNEFGILDNVGKPVSFVEVKIIDSFDNPIKQGRIGEICVRNSVMMTRYICNYEANKLAFTRDGWYRTGDTGYISEDGDIIIKGRTKDIISRGVRKITPLAIENVILQMRGILRVQVVAVPDERLCEEVCACFVPGNDSDIGPDDVKAFCEEKFLSKDAVDGLGSMPKYFLQFDDFPQLSNGKIDRNQLKADATFKIMK